MITAAEQTTEQSDVEVQHLTKSEFGAPEDSVIKATVKAVLRHPMPDPPAASAGLTIRVVEAEEIRSSNKQWRGIDKATNVLSFPADFPVETGIDYLGDILISAEVLQRESTEQNKSLENHWAHIVTHGVLHLLGYDHEHEEDAITMEGLEKEILATLGVPDPYRHDLTTISDF